MRKDPTVEELKRTEHELAILKSLLRGEREIAAGREHELNDVLADVNDILRT
jgi:hypothetical protein